MIRRLSSFIISAAIITACSAAFSACNKAVDDTDPETTDPESLAYGSSTQVSSFNLKRNYKILANLDSVFFSIDLADARIFNADSLPYGTDVSRMQVEVGVQSSSAINVIMKSRFTGQDTTVNLTTNPNDSINFADGPVLLRITSQDERFERVYTVSVNVHQVVADSLVWNLDSPHRLPGTIAAPVAQKAVQHRSEIYCLTTAADGSAELSHTANPFAADSWTTAPVALPAGAITDQLVADAEALYILSADGTLHRSTDGGASWSAEATGFSHLYGTFAGQVVGVSADASQWLCWPSGSCGPVNALGPDFPVSGTSQLTSFTTEWSETPQAIMAGGITAVGSLTGTCWCFDGSGWLCITRANRNYSLPPAEGYTLFPYFSYLTNTNTWRVDERTTWVALGGRTDHTAMQTRVYTSWDCAMTWRLAQQSMQLPEQLTPVSGAQAYVVNHLTTEASRAVKPITEWETPYVYLFGGYTASGSLCNSLLRGTITRMTFKPLQ